MCNINIEPSCSCDILLSSWLSASICTGHLYCSVIFSFVTPLCIDHLISSADKILYSFVLCMPFGLLVILMEFLLSLQWIDALFRLWRENNSTSSFSTLYHFPKSNSATAFSPVVPHVSTTFSYLLVLYLDLNDSYICSYSNFT